MSRYIWRWLPLISLVLLALLFFHQLALTDKILARGDTYSYFYPYWDARNAALRAGELPLWTPYLFGGVPLLANPQPGTFYPLNWLTVPLSAPDGYKLSVLLHVVGAAWGACLLFRQTVSERYAAALLAGSLYGAGGYLGAHVEQINQLQGLAWLPWLLLILHQALHQRRSAGWWLLLTIVWALQLFSGHTQTVFISGVAMGGMVLFDSLSTQRENFSRAKIFAHTLRRLGYLAGAAVAAVSLAVPQILPALELTGMSIRGGGFNVQEATAFSLPPTYLGQALLPRYDGLLFTEYVATIGLIALGLALIGTLNVRRKQGFYVALLILGVLFAFGRFNPLYVLLANLPGFDLFRVPARWLSLFALSAAMLAGYGLVTLQEGRVRRWQIALTGAGLLLLMAAGRLLPVAAVDAIGGVLPSNRTLLFWGIAWLLLMSIACTLNRYHDQSRARWLTLLMCLLVTGELFLATRPLPYNDPVPREIYLGQRFTISQMQAYANEQTIPGRVLSISDLRFDPGDKTQLLAHWERFGLDAQAQQIAFTAVKKQEMLAPNLPLTWDIPSIDGYGGGVLPTIYYSQYVSLLLPETTPRNVDGRIGEVLARPACRGACLPGLEILRRTGVQYLITDKVFDVAHEGLRYDTTLADYWYLGAKEPDFVYTDVYLLHEADLQTTVDETVLLPDGLQRSRLTWETLQTVLTTQPGDVLAVTVADTRTGDFLELQPGDFQRVLSSDVKVYRLPGDVPRAYLSGAEITPDTWDGHESALEILRVNPSATVIHSNYYARSVTEPAGQVTVEHYSPTRVEISVQADSGGYLVLNDAYYPGWRATVNGDDTPIYRANVLFRAVQIGAGESQVVFEFVPQTWYNALMTGVFLWLIALAGGAVWWWRTSRTR